MIKTTRKLLFGKTLFIAFAVTIIITILLVYLTGLQSHRAIMDNALISFSILAFCFFLFLFIGLYNGLNVIDNYSHKLEIMWRKAKDNLPDDTFSGDSMDISGFSDAGDDIGGIIVGIIFWIIFSIILVTLLITFQAVIWLSIIWLTMAIYWIIIRGLKLVFSKSQKCQNDLVKSLLYAFGYTTLYIGWIYGVIFISTLF